MGHRVVCLRRNDQLWSLGGSRTVSSHTALCNAVVNYTSAQLQKAFSPPSFTNTLPTPQLKVNETRVCTEFRLFVELREATELRIPCRESSKVWPVPFDV